MSIPDNPDELSEAQCAMVAALSARIWRMLASQPPEVASTVLIDVLAAFLGRWGAGRPAALRRQIQAEVMVSVAQVTFDVLDLREAGER